MLLTLLFAPTLLIGASAGAISLFRRFGFGAGLLVLTYVLGAIAVKPLGFQAGSFHLYLEDLTGLGLAAAAGARILTGARIRGKSTGWYAFAAATGLAFVVGASAYGLKAAGVEYRGYFYLCAAVVYCATFTLDARHLKTLSAIWLAGAAVLLMLAAFRWSAELLQLGIAGQWAHVSEGHRLRVLNASQTFFLAQALLIAVYLRRPGSILSWFAVMLAGAVVLLQHRSVWIALLLAAFVICRREKVLGRFLSVAAVAVGCVGMTYLAAPDLFSRESEVTDALASSVEEPFADRSTFGWRMELWQAYLLEFLTASDVQKLIGMGFGNQTLYTVENTETADAAHNYYISVLNRTGILGLIAFLAAYLSLLRRVRTKQPAGSWNYSGLFLGIVVSQLVYYTVYSPSPDQGLLAGAIIGIGGGARRVHRDPGA